jgi:hypothetical protein
MSQTMDRRALLAVLTGAGVSLAVSAEASPLADKQLKNLEKIQRDVLAQSEDLLDIAQNWEKPAPELQPNYDVALKSILERSKFLLDIAIKLSGGKAESTPEAGK